MNANNNLFKQISRNRQEEPEIAGDVIEPNECESTRQEEEQVNSSPTIQVDRIGKQRRYEAVILALTAPSMIEHEPTTVRPPCDSQKTQGSPGEGTPDYKDQARSVEPGRRELRQGEMNLDQQQALDSAEEVCPDLEVRSTVQNDKTEKQRRCGAEILALNAAGIQKTSTTDTPTQGPDYKHQVQSEVHGQRGTHADEVPHLPMYQDLHRLHIQERADQEEQGYVHPEDVEVQCTASSDERSNVDVPLFSAHLVEEDSRMIVEAVPMQRTEGSSSSDVEHAAMLSHMSKKCMAAIMAGAIFVVAGVVVAGFCGSGACGSDSFQMPKATTPTPPTPEARNCFLNASQLRNAVDDYLEDSKQGTVVGETYGWPIGSWCVSGIDDMSQLFSKKRNLLARFFIDDISEWNVSAVTNMSFMFEGAEAFNNDLSPWNVSSVVTMRGMFKDTLTFNRDLSTWNVSGVTDMKAMFSKATSFNRNLSSWDVSGVSDMTDMLAESSFTADISSWDLRSLTNMNHMFFNNTVFNGDLSSWNVSQVTSMRLVFAFDEAFNGNLSTWDTSKAKDFYGLFLGADSFNGDVSAWDVSHVTNMEITFADADLFNGDISSWNVSSVNNTYQMFGWALSFNRDLSGWDVSSVTNMAQMFVFARSFNQSHSAWNVSNVQDMSYMFYGATSFRKSLCDWGPKLDETVRVTGMFMDTGCATFSDPVLTSDPEGPFCFPC